MEPYKKYSRDEVGQLVARYYRSETDGAEVHALARGLQIENPSLTYRDALHKILQIKTDPPDDSSLSPARRKMNELLSDRAKTQHLAGVVVDRLARQRITNLASRDPKESYRRAADEIRKEFPDLWRAWQDGFLHESDFSTVALLIPSSRGEIERRHYAAEVRKSDYAARCEMRKYDFPASGR